MTIEACNVPWWVKRRAWPGHQGRPTKIVWASIPSHSVLCHVQLVQQPVQTLCISPVHGDIKGPHHGVPNHQIRIYAFHVFHFETFQSVGRQWSVVRVNLNGQLETAWSHHCTSTCLSMRLDYTYVEPEARRARHDTKRRHATTSATPGPWK